MGWVSYIEDINKRLESDLHNIVNAFTEGKVDALSAKTAIRQITEECKKLLKELSSSLDLATDPRVDMARQITELKKERGDLILRAADAQAREKEGAKEGQEKLREAEEDKNARIKVLQQAIATERNRVQQLEAKLRDADDALFQNTFADARRKF